MEPKLINLHTHKFSFNPKEDVYIGRPSVFGNPFEIGQDGSRKEVLNKYIDWLLEKRFHDYKIEERKKIYENLQTLKGKRLACFCHPLPCHGDILLKLLENKKPKYFLKKNFNKQEFIKKVLDSISIFENNVEKGMIHCPLCNSPFTFDIIKNRIVKGICFNKNCNEFFLKQPIKYIKRKK